MEFANRTKSTLRIKRRQRNCLSMRTPSCFHRIQLHRYNGACNSNPRPCSSSVQSVSPLESNRWNGMWTFAECGMWNVECGMCMCTNPMLRAPTKSQCSPRLFAPRRRSAPHLLACTHFAGSGRTIAWRGGHPPLLGPVNVHTRSINTQFAYTWQYTSGSVATIRPNAYS